MVVSEQVIEQEECRLMSQASISEASRVETLKGFLDLWACSYHCQGLSHRRDRASAMKREYRRGIGPVVGRSREHKLAEEQESLYQKHVLRWDAP
jgi:hypothetical protein